MTRTLVSLNTARSDVPRTGVARTAVDGAQGLTLYGLDGEERADAAAYGLRRALYAYPSEHYGFWQTVRAQALVADWGATLPWGALGENLTLAGLVESQVWIGDVLRFPDCALAVSEPGMPSPGLNEALGFPHAAKLMASSGWCGFFLSVRVPGSIGPGQRFELEPGPRDVGILELFRERMERAAAT
ncbi:MOSC domain-containing protein [Piscinibacter koreensis]|uniref:MOSC domain-containing protein n=1 Tax=Piscinibacter koreensis TaxID=2742824 RepID=A0A7Y6TUX0_9BURK|nr:MOSC domain-containing protein [Schlegelella koreensis]NUZ04307.1 MOSC domain-containing protein [Schlegelella koreensis]